MKKITKITKREIFKLFKDGYHGYGISYYDFEEDEFDFLLQNFDLENMPSKANYPNLKEEFIKNYITNNNYESYFYLKDDTLGLCNDSEYLDFLCKFFHPEIRKEESDWKIILEKINDLLKNDGYEFYISGVMSGRNIYNWKIYMESDKTFKPFSFRHKKIEETLGKKFRQQVLQILSSHNSNFYKQDEFGYNSCSDYISWLEEEVLLLYKLEYYSNGITKPAKNLEDFILNCEKLKLFDIIEIFHNLKKSDSFTEHINMQFKRFDIPYKFENNLIVANIEPPLKLSEIEIKENGLKILVDKSNELYEKGEIWLATQQIWAVFERLKTYYADYDDKRSEKSKSADKLIKQISFNEEEFIEIFTSEFEILSNIGNNFQIRHHEKMITPIKNKLHCEYFYKRCFSLVSIALKYLDNSHGI